ncbi:MAG: pyridoxamine 5-phosphate oxidase [Sphingomonadales bacterium]|nr:MAG: pyridoxamine 5-phosphate oxidase [Sphingomonadales bacterium]
MTHRFAELMFTPEVQAQQEAHGSRGAYARFAHPDASANDCFSEGEAAFIAARDSFYLASVSSSGWPYVQHRGGPAGFLQALDEKTLAFPDCRGNRQYVSVGNVQTEDRVALILVDYPNQRRLKILGRARTLDLDEAAPVLARLATLPKGARAERAILITLEAFDWNCPQHITPRYTKAQVETALAPVLEELEALRAENARLKGLA